MPREWGVDETIQLIITKMKTVAPDNSAMVPFSFALEQDIWHVDVMVKRPHCEYDIHAEATELPIALRGVYKRLGNWQTLERQGEKEW